MTAATTKSRRLISGLSRAKIAATLVEYRAFARTHPADPLAAGLLDTARVMHEALHEQRRIERSIR